MRGRERYTWGGGKRERGKQERVKEREINGARERVMGKRECEESIYTYTKRGQRQGGRETWERECERGITLQSMHMTENAHDLKSYA